MSASTEFTEHILDMLEPLGNVSISSMFSGKLLKMEGRQLGVILGDTLYFKINDQELQNYFKDKRSKQFSYTRKDRKDPVIIKHWWSVPDSAVDDADELISLAKMVLEQ